MLDDPARVEAHVVRHHVVRQRTPRWAARSRRLVVRVLAAEIVRDAVVPQRVAEAAASGLPHSCLMRCDAALRSHRPISHRPVMPNDASRSSSVRDPSSRVTGGLYSRASWSSQYVRALRDQHGARIQCSSGLNASYSTSRRPEAPYCGTAPGPESPPKWPCCSAMRRACRRDSVLKRCSSRSTSSAMSSLIRSRREIRPALAHRIRPGREQRVLARGEHRRAGSPRGCAGPGRSGRDSKYFAQQRGDARVRGAGGQRAVVEQFGGTARTRGSRCRATA